MTVSNLHPMAEDAGDRARRPKARPPLPEAHADVALCDLTDVCALVRMSASWVHVEVREGRFPQPLRYGPRCTRWTLASIRAWLIERATQPPGEGAELVVAKAKKASAAALAKRKGSVPRTSQTAAQ